MIDYKTSDILDLYKSKFYEQYNKPIQIGSDDFAAASVHAYVLGVLVGAINKEAGNAFIDTATGEALDGIAATFGLSRPSGYKSKIRVHFTYQQFSGVMPEIIPAHSIVITHGGVAFENAYDITAHSGATVYADQTLYAIEPGAQNNNIPANAQTTITRGSFWVSACEVLSESDGGQDAFPMTEAGDNDFRVWLKTEIQTLAGAGTYLAYEAKAMNADPRVLGVHVLRQNETGYQKGKVNIFVYTTDTSGTVLSAVYDACNDPAFRPIGDLVVVDDSGLSVTGLTRTIQVTYQPQFIGDCEARTASVVNAYLAELRTHIGMPFCYAELCRRLITKDDEGVYAIDATPLGVTQSEYTTPLYPAPGKRLDINTLTTDIVIGGE